MPKKKQDVGVTCLNLNNPWEGTGLSEQSEEKPAYNLGLFNPHHQCSVGGGLLGKHEDLCPDLLNVVKAGTVVHPCNPSTVWWGEKDILVLAGRKFTHIQELQVQWETLYQNEGGKQSGKDPTPYMDLWFPNVHAYTCVIPGIMWKQLNHSNKEELHLLGWTQILETCFSQASDHVFWWLSIFTSVFV